MPHYPNRDSATVHGGPWPPIHDESIKKQEIDFDARYTVDGMPGAAFYLRGYWPTGLDFDGEQTYDEDFVCAVAVGDDYAHCVDPDDLTVIADEDYCSSCGQIGCTRHGREV